ncbi:putative duf455 domain protein [Rosellinia necatrix]|uniref:Putative duf455 domain protein n=1 Tax=Rosellinia necatrix TaxID=77044 RepID=A0A1W2TJ70_ROSNE|nr:putative duf455 domain protein [Rosellinia necatrix]
MQGFNMGRYVPPDVEGTISGNALNRKHALGARASKLRTEGILTVRFEMPFGVWCGTCPKPTIIGQGVRFNAEKKKVGAYHSTPIWSFRMRHADCSGLIEIRTDPANAEYVVTEGGTRRDTGDGKDDSLVSSGALVGGVGEILTGKEKDALRNDAFARLEKTIEDRAVLIERSHRIAELEDVSYRAWEDPYAQNRRLRAAFRADRKAREKAAAGAEDLQERMSLGIDLLPATDEDARRAALVDFGIAAVLDSSATDENGNSRATSPNSKDTALIKPLFGSSAAIGVRNATSKVNGNAVNRKLGERKGKKQLKSEIKASQTRESLASEITRNARVSQDPFLLGSSHLHRSGGDEGAILKPTARIQGIKRKRPTPSTPASASASAPASPVASKKLPRQELTPEDKAEVREDGAGREIPTLADTGYTRSPGTELRERPPGAGLVEYDSD